MAGDVITTGTKAADATGVDAERDTEPAVHAQQAKVAEADDVPGSATAEVHPKDPQAPSDASEPAAPGSAGRTR